MDLPDKRGSEKIAGVCFFYFTSAAATAPATKLRSVCAVCVCNFLETFFRGRESANIFCTVLLLVTTYNYSKKVFGRFVFSVVVVAASSVNHLPSVVHFVYPFG